MAPSLDFILSVKGRHLRSFDLIYININIPAFVCLYDYYFLLLLCSLQLSFSRLVVSDSADTMDCGTPGFCVLHHLLELDQSHVH